MCIYNMLSMDAILTNTLFNSNVASGKKFCMGALVCPLHTCLVTWAQGVPSTKL